MARRGPGKFSTNLDAYAYELTTDGGADEEASYGEGNGWYGLIWIDADARKAIREIAAGDVALDEDDEVLDGSGAVILFERSDGIVETHWYNSDRKAQSEWEAIEADTAEEEEDEEEDEEDEEEDDVPDEGDEGLDQSEIDDGLVISDARGGKYSVSMSGKSLGSFSDFDDALIAGIQKANDENYFPNVFHVNDHGNVDLLSIKPEIKRGKVVSVEYKIERSWV